MPAALAARRFEALTPAAKRARAYTNLLRWAVFVAVLLNMVVWGGIVSARGLVDLPALMNQVWSLGATWIAAISRLSVTFSY